MQPKAAGDDEVYGGGDQAGAAGSAATDRDGKQVSADDRSLRTDRFKPDKARCPRQPRTPPIRALARRVRAGDHTLRWARIALPAEAGCLPLFRADCLTC